MQTLGRGWIEILLATLKIIFKRRTKMKKLALFALAVLLYCVIYVSCDTTEPCVRVGAYCNDGTTSTATGSGACSGHGGVRDWICE